MTDHDFDDCFRASYARLVRLLTAASGDAELAADCVQEAFVRAHVRWRKIGRYEDPVSWVRRVALNLVRDHARRAARKRRAHDRLAAQGEAERQGAVPADQPHDLLAILAELPPQSRMAVALHYVEGLPVREVAEEMGLSEGAVKFHLHAGRERLRRGLDVAKEGER
ncbi:MAG TPA: sigma-70 family RNA polymerase sigma factor [Acidimicrobiales bacterium]